MLRTGTTIQLVPKCGSLHRRFVVKKKEGKHWTTCFTRCCGGSRLSPELLPKLSALLQVSMQQLQFANLGLPTRIFRNSKRATYFVFSRRSASVRSEVCTSPVESPEGLGNSKLLTQPLACRRHLQRMRRQFEGDALHPSTRILTITHLLPQYLASLNQPSESLGSRLFPEGLEQR